MAALCYGVVQNTQIKSVKPKETKSQIQFKSKPVSPWICRITALVMGAEFIYLNFTRKNKNLFNIFIYVCI